MITKLLGFTSLLSCLAVVFFFETSSSAGGAFRVFHWPAMVLTGLGPLSLMICCSDWQIMFRTMGLALGSSPFARQRKHEREAVFLQQLGARIHAEGPKVLDQVKVRGISVYVEKVIERLAVRMPTPDIRALLVTEKDRNQSRINQCTNVISLGVRLAPSVGMLGTILGMVQLLSTLDDPSKIGSHMSLALLTTFYGLFFSLAIWTPFQQKLERVCEVELDGYEQVIRWLEFLEKRKPADYFADSLGTPKKTAPPLRREAA